MIFGGKHSASVNTMHPFQDHSTVEIFLINSNQNNVLYIIYRVTFKALCQTFCHRLSLKLHGEWFCFSSLQYGIVHLILLTNCVE